MRSIVAGSEVRDLLREAAFSASSRSRLILMFGFEPSDFLLSACSRYASRAYDHVSRVCNGEIRVEARTRNSCNSCSCDVLLMVAEIISGSGDGVRGMQPSICRVSRTIVSSKWCSEMGLNLTSRSVEDVVDQRLTTFSLHWPYIILVGRRPRRKRLSRCTDPITSVLTRANLLLGLTKRCWRWLCLLVLFQKPA